MKGLKGSAGAKIAAWIGITISGIVFLGSILGAVLIQQAGVYDDTIEEMRQMAYEEVAEHYSVIALNNIGQNEQFQDTYFRYGIIQADNTDDIDWNAESTYVERNFTNQVTEEALYKKSYEIGDDTQFNYSNTLFGGYSIYDSASSYIISEQVYGVCYDETDGIFYYETSGKFYPVRQVVIEVQSENGIESYTFAYDFDKRLYRNLNRIAEGDADAAEAIGADEFKEEETVVKSSTFTQISEAGENQAALETDENTDMVLERKYLTLNMLGGLVLGNADWYYLKLDGVEYYDSGKLLVVSRDYITEIADETDYKLTDGDILEINHRDGEPTMTYWVVSILPESVGTGWSRDLFVQANTLITLAYGLRYSIYVIMLISFAVSVILFVFLIAASGHRKGAEGIVLTWIDRTPLEIYLAYTFLAEVFFVFLLSEIGYVLDESILWMVFFGCIVLCIFWQALLTILTCSVRLKAGGWWKNTIIYRILSWIGRIIHTLMKHIALLWKAVLVIGILFVIDFLMMASGYVSGGVFLFWFMEKLVLIPLILWAVVQMSDLQEGGRKIAEGDLKHQIDVGKMFWEFKKHGENLNSISTGMSRAVDERMKSERFKTELITNVSHDIKTPLTSIINYVDLLEKENLQNETAEEYLEVLERQSARLKKLIEDLMEASKASTGNLAVNLEKLEAGVFLVQTVGEFEEKTNANGLELLISKPEKAVYIMADGRHFWRVIDNLMNNICKYAQPSTRVYIDMEEKEEKVILTFRNTSRYPLNISSQELMERFVRGDSSRNTEGSGLGLSIARSLMELMDGTFQLYVDGDLFKVVLEFGKVLSEQDCF